MKEKVVKDPISARARAVLRANQRLQKEFPGQYVAYLEAWRRSGSGARLVRRILGHGASMKEVNAALANLSARDRARVMMQYVDDSPADAIRVHYDLPWRL